MQAESTFSLGDEVTLKMTFLDLFSEQGSEKAVETRLLEFIDQHLCDRTFRCGTRRDPRVAVTVAVLVYPVCDGHLRADRAFAAVTKDICATGVSLILNRPFPYTDVVIGLEQQSGVHFVSGKVRQTSTLGHGFRQIGIELSRLVQLDEHPELCLAEV